MGLEEMEFIGDDDAGGGKSPSSSSVSCSICLELVTFSNERSCVKLICGHEFHLDCIGSAFNSRGTMQCPNCRNTEKGQWLYGSGGPTCDDPHDEEFYDFRYSEMSFGVRWCPFTFSQLPSPFDTSEGEYPSTAYHDLLGRHALFPEHTPASSGHPCPYFSYYGPNSNGIVSDNSFSNHWSGLSGPSEMPSSYNFQGMDPHYPSWEHHPSSLPAPVNRLGSLDQPINQRLARPSSDAARPGFFVHPFPVGQSSGMRASNNMTLGVTPPYPGSAARTRDRIQALQAYFQPSNAAPPTHVPVSSGTQHSAGQRSSAPVASSSDQAGGFYVFPPDSSYRNFPEADNQMSRSFHPWERDRLSSLFAPLNHVERDAARGIIHQTPVSGTGSFWQRLGSDQTQSQGRL